MYVPLALLSREMKLLTPSEGGHVVSAMNSTLPLRIYPYPLQKKGVSIFVKCPTQSLILWITLLEVARPLMAFSF